MPDGNGARLPRQDGHVGEHRARTAEQTRSLPQASLPLFIAVPKILLNNGRVLIGWDVWHVFELQDWMGAVAQFGKGDVEAPRLHALVVPPPPATGANTHQVHGAVTDVMIAISLEILCGKFPVARHNPFLDTP